MDRAPLTALSSLASFSRLELTRLFSIAEWQDEVPWQPFREGLEIHRLYGDGESGPSAALLRFKQTGEVPLHEHGGFEHIFVLAGKQRDQNSEAAAGTLMINPPGSVHRVIGDAGCIVLAIYEKPVRFIAEPAA